MNNFFIIFRTKSNMFTRPVSILKLKADGNNNCTTTVLKRNSCQPQLLRSCQSQSSCSKSSVYDNEISKKPTNIAQLQSKITFSKSNDVDDPEYQDDSIVGNE